jgi:DNA-binding NarL/FixJ family response regulator
VIETMGPFADETSIAEKVARDVLGQETYAEVEKRGLKLFTEPSELQQVALGTFSIDTSSPATKSTSSWEALSAAEQEIAVLAAAGWSNSAIGLRRGTSSKTTDAQMSSIFQKLTITSREDIVRFVPRDQHGRVSAERAHIPGQIRDKPRSIRDRSEPDDR